MISFFQDNKFILAYLLLVAAFAFSLVQIYHLQQDNEDLVKQVRSSQVDGCNRTNGRTTAIDAKFTKLYVKVAQAGNSKISVKAAEKEANESLGKLKLTECKQQYPELTKPSAK